MYISAKTLSRQLMLDLSIFGEVTKAQGIASDYKVEASLARINDTPEYDAYINLTVVPKKRVENIVLDLILSGGE